MLSYSWNEEQHWFVPVYHTTSKSTFLRYICNRHDFLHDFNIVTTWLYILLLYSPNHFEKMCSRMHVKRMLVYGLDCAFIHSNVCAYVLECSIECVDLYSGNIYVCIVSTSPTPREPIMKEANQANTVKHDKLNSHMNWQTNQQLTN